VIGLRPGDRVVYQTNLGAYAERRLIRADLLIRLPDAVDDRTAAAGFLKGLTAYCLLHETFKVGPGTTLLFHAAAGGVGSLACQWARALGATVIGTVGSAAKVEAARANGCHHVIDMGTEDFVARVKTITGGAGVDVVYDSIGKDAFPGNLDCLRPRGLWCAFGQSSGPSPEFQMSLLAQKGSLFATRMTVFVYLAKRPALETAAAALFKAFADGTVRIAARQEFALKDAAKAQAALEGRKTRGQTLLIP
jgi:NADPH2:quinone reductase